MRLIIVPVGVTKETIEGLLKELPRPNSIVVVTVPGFEDVKKPIIEALRGAASTLGAGFHVFTVKPRETEGIVSIYRLLLEERPGEVYLVGVTGSRYLLPVLVTVLLRYWRDTGARVYLVHGVEGEQYYVEPLQGFYATAMRLTRVQKHVLSLVYGSVEPVSGKTLIERYGFARSVYYVLADLERKGLLLVRRNRIEKTFPGKLVYELLKASGEVD